MELFIYIYIHIYICDALWACAGSFRASRSSTVPLFGPSQGRGCHERGRVAASHGNLHHTWGMTLEYIHHCLSACQLTMRLSSLFPSSVGMIPVTVSIFLSVCLFACLHVCLSVFFHASVSLLACLSACLSACLLAMRLTSWFLGSVALFPSTQSTTTCPGSEPWHGEALRCPRSAHQGCQHGSGNGRQRQHPCLWDWGTYWPSTTCALTTTPQRMAIVVWMPLPSGSCGRGGV